MAQNIHCIGDRANKIVLDAFEDVINRTGVDLETWRPRIEHAQIMQLSDIDRLGRLGGAWCLNFFPPLISRSCAAVGIICSDTERAAHPCASFAIAFLPTYVDS